MKALGLYSDLDLSLVPHPLTGDLAPKKDAEAVARSVKHLVFWNAFDMPFDPTLKSAIKSYLFGANNHVTRANLETDIRWILTTLEPRIKLKSVDVAEAMQGQAFDITITYALISLSREETVNFIVERVR